MVDVQMVDQIVMPKNDFDVFKAKLPYLFNLNRSNRFLEILSLKKYRSSCSKFLKDLRFN